MDRVVDWIGVGLGDGDVVVVYSGIQRWLLFG
jgi:hypothetical protein